MASTATCWLFVIKVSEFYTGEATWVAVTGAAIATGAGVATVVAVTVTGAPVAAAA